MMTLTHKGREYQVAQADTFDNLGTTYTVTSPRGNMFVLIETNTPGLYAMGGHLARRPFTFVKRTDTGWEVVTR